nr:hypothetical protein [Clavibacter michiganensis]
MRAAAAAEDPAGDAERRRLHDQIVLDHLELADQLARQHSGARMTGATSDRSATSAS